MSNPYLYTYKHGETIMQHLKRSLIRVLYVNASFSHLPHHFVFGDEHHAHGVTFTLPFAMRARTLSSHTHPPHTPIQASGWWWLRCWHGTDASGQHQATDQPAGRTGRHQCRHERTVECVRLEVQVKYSASSVCIFIPNLHLLCNVC